MAGKTAAVPIDDGPKRSGSFVKKLLKLLPVRYSLLTLFVVVTACCVFLALWSNSARQQMRVAAWVEEQGGRVIYAWELDEDGYNDEKAVSPVPDWMRDVLGEDYFHSVALVDLSDAPVSDISLLAKLKNLKVIYLYDTQVSDISPLAKLKNLENLYLMETPVSDISPLAVLKNLLILSLNDTQVSDLSPLAELKNLVVLRLSGTPVSDEEIEKLNRALPSLKIGR